MVEAHPPIPFPLSRDLLEGDDGLMAALDALDEVQGSRDDEVGPMDDLARHINDLISGIGIDAQESILDGADEDEAYRAAAATALKDEGEAICKIVEDALQLSGSSAS